METIKAPFTDEQVASLNEYQQLGLMHPFTCCSHDGCKKDATVKHGILIASNEGWTCPCGKWKQDWAHKFMTDVEALKNTPFGKIAMKHMEAKQNGA